ncbi:MAG: 50S ribosomal protein L17 [Planctomycetota bacterium]
MRHNVRGRTLGRKTNHRRAMWRNMAVSLFTHEQITTTIPKAKSVQPFVEKLITQARKGDLDSRRRVISALGGNKLMVANDEDEAVNELRNRYGELDKRGRLKAPRVVHKLCEEIAPRYADRAGGYTRIIKLGAHRLGDGADLCVLQLVSDDDSGPQVRSRGLRRARARKRMEFAAALRKGDGAGSGKSEQEASAQIDDGAAAAAAEPPAEAPAESEAPPEAPESGEAKGDDKPAG